MSAASNQDDGEFLLWGNDDGALSETSTGNPAGIAQRLQRVWRVNETGELGTTTLVFDLSSHSVSGTVASDFKIIVDNDTDFSTGATLVSASSYVGGIATFTGVNLDDGQFFALGTAENNLPIADAGGPYTINEGDVAPLNASGSNDTDGAIVAYEWDLDNDGVFSEVGEPTGLSPVVSWATLQSFGIG